MAFLVFLGTCLEISREKLKKIEKILLPTVFLWESFSTFSKWTFLEKKKCPKLKMLCIYAHFCCDWSVRAFLWFFLKMRAFSRKNGFWVIYTFGFWKMIIFEKNEFWKKKLIIFYTFWENWKIINDK